MPRKLRTNAAVTAGFRAGRRRRLFRWPAAALVAVLLAAGCASLGASDNPVLSSLGWFDFLNGSDIREACGAAAGDRFRLVYNAVWGEQVRIYEVVVPGNGGAATLTARVRFPERLSAMDLTDPLQLYRGKTSTVALAPQDVDELVQRLRQSSYDDPPPAGLVLPSDGFYWVVSSCAHGIARFNAYVWPSRRFAAIAFADWLFARDRTDVPVAAPHPSAPRPPNRDARQEADYSIFDLQVGTNGLVGIP